ncbi:hypothetical protein [Lysobacter sp. 22409]|uniref:hypothetical protein n=1 Tax=Lysobacter sp. 22409 TaxID=3453917 RepID=UPI003F87212C
MRQKQSGINWSFIAINTLMAIIGALVMGSIRWTTTLSEGQAEWSNVIATVLTGTGAVLGGFFLWRHQQNEKSKQLRAVGIAIFIDVYHRLLELEVFTNYDRWLNFFRQVYNISPSEVPIDSYQKHKDAGIRFIESLIHESRFAVDNFAVLRDNLGDVEEEQLEAMLRLFTYLSGITLQLKKLHSAWKATDITSLPASLSPEAARILEYGIGACAYFLGKLDGIERSKERTALYEKFYSAQKEIHND